MLARIRWKLARTVLTGGVLGCVLVAWVLAVSTEFPWPRFMGGPVLLTSDGLALFVVAAVALAAGGVVQLVIHEWHLRSAFRAPDGAGPPGDRAAVAALRTLPLASAVASLLSWTVGGVTLGLLCAGYLSLGASLATRMALICSSVGAGLAPFRYLRVRLDSRPLWDELISRGAEPAADGERGVFPIRAKLVLGIGLPVWGAVLVTTAAAVHRHDLTVNELLQRNLDQRATDVATLLDRAVKEMQLIPSHVRELVIKLLREDKSESSEPRIALLDRSGGLLTGTLGSLSPKALVAALEGADFTATVGLGVVGAARMVAAPFWVVVVAPAGSAPASTALVDPAFASILALAVLVSFAVAWAMARDTLDLLASMQSQLESWQSVGVPPRLPSHAAFGDDEIAELGASLNALAIGTRRQLARVERNRATWQTSVRRVVEKLGEVLADAERGGELGAFAHRTVDRLKEGRATFAELSGTSAREVESRLAAAGESAQATERARESCDRAASFLDEANAGISHLLAIVRPLVQDLKVGRMLAETALGALGGIEDSRKGLEAETRQATDAARASAASIREGQQALQDSLDRIGRIRAGLGEVGQSVHRVEEKTAALNRILHVLDEVGERTALLAVNAAILAARVEDRVGGFTIVADEIRDLAQRASDSVRDVGEVTGALATESRAAVRGFEVVLRRIEEGEAAIRDGRATLARTAQGVAEAAQRISRSSEMTDTVGGDLIRSRQSLEELVALAQRLEGVRGGVGVGVEESGTAEVRCTEAMTELRTRVVAELIRATEASRTAGRPSELEGRLDVSSNRLAIDTGEIETTVRSLSEVHARASNAARSAHDLATRLERELESPSVADGSSRT